MNYQDSSSDDIPYLPPERYKNYTEQHRVQPQPASSNSLAKAEQRHGRSYFTEDELRELDSTSEETSSGSTCPAPVPTESPIPRPPITFNDSDLYRANNLAPSPDATNPVPVHLQHGHGRDLRYSPSSYESTPKRQISWGRRFIGILLIAMPAVMFSVAAHFIDWSMSDFQLFSASFFIFQGVFWPSLGILIADYFCVSKTQKRESMSVQKVIPRDSQNQHATSHRRKWISALTVFVHANVFATAMIFQLLSIQHLNITLSLALSFGFDVIVMLIHYILATRKCSLELILLSLMSYLGYGIAAIPAFTSKSRDTRYDTAIGVGASVGVMVLGVTASLLLTKLKKNHVTDSVIGTSFAFFGCILSLITKEIMGSKFEVHLEGKAVGWAAGLISVVFLGTIFLYLESRLSGLVWKRDEDHDVHEYSTVTKTRLAVFILSCGFELSRQGFRDTKPDPYDIFGGLLVVLAFLLASGFRAWHNNMHYGLTADQVDAEEKMKPKFCAFIPWLFAQPQRKAEDRN